MAGYEQNFGNTQDWNKDKATEAGQPWYGNDLQYELGDLQMQSDLMSQLMNNPQLADLYQKVMGGFDPRVSGQLDQMGQLQQDVLGGGFFGDEQEQIFKDLMSGKTLAGQGGTIYDMIQEQYAPQRNEARNYAASMGMAPTSGGAMSMMGNQVGQQDRAYADQMVNKYMQMVGLGSTGLNTMGGEQFQRQQYASNIGQWLSQFVEGAQQNRGQMGMGITGMQQQPLQQLLEMSYMQRQKPSAWENISAALGELAPMAISAMFPGAAPAMAGFGGGNVFSSGSGGGGDLFNQSADALGGGGSGGDIASF